MAEYTEFKETFRSADGKSFFKPEQPASADTDSFKFSLKSFVAWLRSMGVNLPSFQRFIIAAFAAIGTAVACIYGGQALCAMLVVGAMSLTTIPLVLMAVWCIGALLALYVASKLVVMVFRWIISGSLEDAVADIRNQIWWAIMPDPKPVRNPSPFERT